MTHRVRILSISDDDGLRFSRELLLKSEGYETESMTSNVALSAAIAGQFDIVLICRSVDNERAIALTNRLRKNHPEVQVVCVSPRQSDPVPHDADVEVSPGPEPILEAIRILCDQVRQPKIRCEVFSCDEKTPHLQ